MTVPFEGWRQDYLTDADYRALQNLPLVNPLLSRLSIRGPWHQENGPAPFFGRGASATQLDLIQGLGGSRRAAVSSVNSAALGAGKVTFPVATHSAPRAKVT
jgi:hypothetical protein